MCAFWSFIVIKIDGEWNIDVKWGGFQCPTYTWPQFNISALSGETKGKVGCKWIYVKQFHNFCAFTFFMVYVQNVSMHYSDDFPPLKTSAYTGICKITNKHDLLVCFVNAIVWFCIVGPIEWIIDVCVPSEVFQAAARDRQTSESVWSHVKVRPDGPSLVWPPPVALLPFIDPCKAATAGQ